jgi:hypothetical protein
MHIGSLRRKEILPQVSTELLDPPRLLEVRSSYYQHCKFFVFSQVIIVVFGRIVCFMF